MLSKPLQDLIGVMSHGGLYNFTSPTSQKKLRKINIRELEEQTQEVLLWGKHGESFDEKSVFEKSEQGIIVAIFAGVTAGSFSGKTQASSTSATQVFIDLDNPEVTKFRNSYQWETPNLQHQLPQMVQVPPSKAAGKIYKISEICELPISSFQGGATASCIAKVTSILPHTKWYYKACRRCKRGYSSISDAPRCDCPTSHPIPMYKLPLTITYETGSMDAIAFSAIAKELVERTALEASQNMKLDVAGETVSLQTAIGKTKLFYIGMNTEQLSSFPIKYVLRKSFQVDQTSSSLLPQSSELNSKKNLGFPKEHI
ncbi:hypothetical protein BS78_09G034100 [Paspalum vaginatum]|nr:hypothetical protein BS78_09G034100 [Paspalum vaginatum]